jgi:hypothetical protein
MSPNPLSKVRRYAEVVYGVEHVTKIDPEIAALAMQVIANCSYADLELTQLAARFAKSDFAILASMLAPMRSFRPQIIEEAARTALSKDDFEMFQGVMSYIGPIKGKRDDYAHCIWATSPQLPDCLLLIPDQELAEIDASHAAWFADFVSARRRIRQNPEMRAAILAEEERPVRLELDKSKVCVYRKAEIRKDVMDAWTASELVMILSWALNPDSRLYAEGRAEILRVLETKKQTGGARDRRRKSSRSPRR